MTDLPVLHGYPVVALAVLPDSEGTRKNLRVIIVDRGAALPYDRFVVSLWCVGDEQWMSGSYCETMVAAARVFCDKLSRGYPTGAAAGVPMVCCQSLAISILAGRPVTHSKACPNRRP